MTTQSSTVTDYTPQDTAAMIRLNAALRRKIKRLTSDLTRALARVDELETARTDATETIRYQATQIARLRGKVKRLGDCA